MTNVARDNDLGGVSDEGSGNDVTIVFVGDTHCWDQMDVS